MRSTLGSLALVYTLAFALVPLAGPAQTAKPAPAPDAYKNESVVIERSETTYKMNADGTGERDIHIVLRVQSDGAAQQFGVLTFPYASAYETPVVKFLRVRKPDGSMVDTPPSDAIDMPADVTREAPLYSDLKEMHLPVRSLSTGDTLEYEIDTHINKAEAPGEFWGADHFTPPGTVVVLAEVLNLEVPADKYVQVWSPNHKPTMTEQNGVRTYSWNLPQLVIAPKNTGDQKAVPPKDPDEDDDGRKLPSVAWTTFHNWAEVGDWYRGLALQQAQPNDALRARAADLTKDAKSPEDQVRNIYDFVSAQTRYVGIDFGIGRYQPHAAAEVLADGYGDCKDKDTLLEALLRAKGFSTAPALIGAGIAPVPDVPSPAVFNHVITTVNLPDGRIWLDSTPLGAPYRYLSAVIRDQKALIVPADKPALLESTPADAPYPFTARFDADGTLDAEGKLTAKMTATYHDDDELVVRALARGIAPAEWDKASQYISSMTGFGGTTSNTKFENAGDASQPIVMTYDYARHPFGDWNDLRIVPLFPALEFTPLDSDTTEPQEDIQLGAPRTLTAVSRIRLPDGFRADLPDAIHVKTDFANFDKTYSYEGDGIVVTRTIVVLKDKVARADWKKYEAFTKDISLDGEAWIQLIRPSKYTAMAEPKLIPRPPGNAASGSGSQSLSLSAGSVPGPESPSAASSAATPSDKSASELMADAQDEMKQGEWSEARQTLDEVKAKNPDEENLWSGYGIIAAQHLDFDEAQADFRKEVAAHPDNAGAVAALASAESRNGDAAGAQKTLEDYLARNPSDTRLTLYLASLERSSGDYAAELKTLEAAAGQDPDNRELRVQESEALVRLNRNQEAAAAAKSALDDADDPEVLNDGAYELSLTGLDLDVAESASRKSVDQLEEKSTGMTTDQANSHAFAQANLLVASWDTLGWILFREGKTDAAKPYLTAAWRSGLASEVGDHLAQLLESLGQKDEACSTYVLAQAALTKNDSPEVRAHIQESIRRLKAAGAKPGPANPTQALQDLRTFKVARPADAGGWGAFRLEVSTAGVIEAQKMSGEQKISAMEPALEKMKLPELLPPDSKAHLLRSAVVSCSIGSTCDVVLVPDGGLQTEQ
jgi:tetratricopeptide (TPR) repeat protein/transglutaminase-like putative cysteine protease